MSEGMMGIFNEGGSFAGEFDGITDDHEGF